MTLAQTPTVSIGVPVYNGENFLRNCLDSLLAQTYTDFEIVISDNASTDQTSAICAEYAARDPRVRHIRAEKNLGAAWNHNRAFELSRGKYFKWQSHDDMVEPTFLERCVTILDSDPTVVVAYPKTRLIDDHGETIRLYDWPMQTDDPDVATRFRDMACLPHRCFQVYGLMRADVLRTTPLIEAYVPSDRILLVRLALLGRFHEIPEFLFLSRSHAGQSVKIKFRQRGGWFDTAKRKKIIFPQWRTLYEYYRQIRAVPLTSRDRMRCYAHLLTWIGTNKNWARMANDLILGGQAIVATWVTSLKQRNVQQTARRGV